MDQNSSNNKENSQKKSPESLNSQEKSFNNVHDKITLIRQKLKDNDFHSIFQITTPSQSPEKNSLSNQK